MKARTGQKIETIGEFLEIIKPLFGREREKKELAKVFQALRIEVNQEMEALKEMLMAATEALKPGGRLVVITYHSLDVYKRQTFSLTKRSATSCQYCRSANIVMPALTTMATPISPINRMTKK